MAPSVDILQPGSNPISPQLILKAQNAARSKLTSGQHDQLAETVLPYDQYPKRVQGPKLWRRDDYQTNPERWIHDWTSTEIQQIETAAKAYQQTGLPLTAITKETFKLPAELANFLHEAREDLLNGKGFVLFKGLPVHEWTVELSATAFTGLGTYFGYSVSQNGKGHILGHVKDLGNDPTQIDKVRIYSTNARQFFHVDDADLVGLLCMHRAKEGGESDIVSSYEVFNILQRDRPDVVKTLTELWHYDRKGEVSPDLIESGKQKPWHQTQIFQWYKNKLITRWDPYFVKSLSRFSDAGLIPALTEAQKEAAQVFEDTCMANALHMVLEVGDIQIVSNTHVLHSRTAYVDHLPPKPRRQLMRLWLSTPESEGGIPLPLPDSGEILRGGIQVGTQPHTSPLDGE